MSTGRFEFFVSWLECTAAQLEGMAGTPAPYIEKLRHLQDQAQLLVDDIALEIQQEERRRALAVTARLFGGDNDGSNGNS